MRSARHAKHARPARPVLGHVLLASSAAGVLAVPVTASLLADTPGEAAAAARGPVASRVADSPERVAAYDAAVTGQKASAVQTAAEQAAAEQARARQVAAEKVAAEQAAQQQAAADQAAQRAAAQQAAQSRASRSRTPVPAPAPAPAVSGDPRSVAREMLAARGEGAQFSCLDSLWTKESGWLVSADNPSSSAYGIPQALPGSKMASAGADWRTNPRTQIAWGLSYIDGRYGSPCAAWSHSRSYNWY